MAVDGAGKGVLVATRPRAWARTADGVELPIVDVTDPAFALEVRPDELPALVESSVARMEQLTRMPRPVGRLFRSSLARNSVLLGGRARSGAFMSGMTTYLNKPGPDNLDPAWAGRMDDRVSRMMPCVAVRLRLRSVARLLADHLATALTPGSAPVELLNIGGGPASDSLNALILLNTERPGLLAGRSVVVRVLDIDETGPRFASECARVLTATGGALDGLDVSVAATRHDWADAAGLPGELGKARGLTVGSSEGGLFEYGADAEIAAALEALHGLTGPGFALVGSVWRDTRLTRAMRATSPLRFHLRDPDAFAAVIGAAGWTVDATDDSNPVYLVVRLRKA